MSISPSTDQAVRTRPYRTRIVRSIDEVTPEIADLRLAAGANFNYGREFLRGYEYEPIQPVRDLHYLEVRDAGDTLVAFVPCYVQGDPLGALGLTGQERALLSHVWHCSDSRLVSPRPTADLAGHVLSVMRDIAGDLGVARYGFINVAQGSATAAALAGAGLTGTPIDTRYSLDLAGCGDEEGYLRTLTKRARWEYRRHLRRAADAGVQVVTGSATDDVDPERLEIFETSMARVGSAGYYRKEKIAAFLAHTPSARTIEITLDDKLLAMAILFVEEGVRIHTWAGGYDRETPLPFSPYYVLWASCLRMGFAAGVPTLEGGRRNGAFKERYGQVPVRVNAYLAGR